MTEFPEIEAVLDRFRQWLQDSRDRADPLDGEPPLLESEAAEVGLYQLIEEFTALRQEVKLQTKSTRGLQEEAQSLMDGLRRAIEQFRAVESKEGQAVQAAGKPPVEALADLDEALDRGRAEIEKVHRRLVEEAPQALEADLDALYRRQSWLGRRITRSFHQQTRDVLLQHVARQSELFDALLEGYSLIQARLRRGFESADIERIATVGQLVNPERMTVVEVLDDPDQPPGLVVDEVRRGYTWRGRVLRYAEVRVTRTRTRNDNGTPEPVPDPFDIDQDDERGVTDQDDEWPMTDAEPDG